MKISYRYIQYAGYINNIINIDKTIKFHLSLFLTVILIVNLFFMPTVSAETGNIPNSVNTVNFVNSVSTVTSVQESQVVFENEKARIDFTDSNKTGTVKINALSKSDKRIKVSIAKNNQNSQIYTYDLKNDATAEIYPLQMGNGEYIIEVLFQTANIRYRVGLTAEYTLNLSDANAPFLNPNQYVNYSEYSKISQKAAELTENCKSDLEKVEEIYKFVIHSLEYDENKAGAMKSGYLPSVDAVVDSGKGICFDYAAVFAAMLRSQNIPAKLVMGYISTNAYHAWNEIYLKDHGGKFTINNMKFDGKKFERVDTAFDSSSKSNKKVLQFIGDGTNYTKFQEY